MPLVPVVAALLAGGLTAGVTTPPAPAAAPAELRAASPEPVAARLAVLEAQADDTGVAAQRADEALLQRRPGARAATAAAQAALVRLAEQQRGPLTALAAEASTAGVASADVQLAVAVSRSARSKAMKAVRFARHQIGRPYRFAGAGRSGYDCSGLTMRAYSAAHLGIGGHGATAQWRKAKARHRLVSFSHVRPGDLIFYGRPGSVYHVAIASGHGRMIEAPYPGKRVREVHIRGGHLGVVGRPA